MGLEILNMLDHSYNDRYLQFANEVGNQKCIYSFDTYDIQKISSEKYKYFSATFGE